MIYFKTLHELIENVFKQTNTNFNYHKTRQKKRQQNKTHNYVVQDALGVRHLSTRVKMIRNLLSAVE